ncbi:methionine import ATP-binding protein MetN [Planctomycetales bacterium]|nr:methionine import ATP-binding protein MetN [Planctomycetales bacterium]GHS98795.1 methionine import ATP-binding protein MetN [Planctomycetales bacterium]GHT06555.1 methionine import ATP-binding protein MetN [Planctomycetales bacterium]
MPLIELRHVNKVFGSAAAPIYAMRDVSMTVAAGETFGIIGSSGAGKSTLVRCLNRLETPTSGEVIIDGENIAALNQAELRRARRNLGMIFQHFNLLVSYTALDNVALPLVLAGASKKEARARAAAMLELVGLPDRAAAYPAQLSGGQKQRVGIARALATKPKILLSDEATNALDPETSRHILALIKNLQKQLNLTVVLITHEMNVVAEICDRVAVMENGEVIESGTMFDVFTQPRRALTKNFVEMVLRRDDDIDDYRPQGQMVRVFFRGKNAEDSLLAEIVHRFNVKVNLRQAFITHLQNLGCGTALIDLTGEPAARAQAVAYLRDCGQIVEEV